MLVLLAAACHRKAAAPAPAPLAPLARPDAGATAWTAAPDAGADVPDARAILARLDLAARRKALHGAWIGVRATGSSDVTPEAIAIDGDQVRIWDGRALATYRLGRNDFCSVHFDRPPAFEDGVIYDYLVRDGVASVGLGDSGERFGGGAIVCAGSGLYVVDDAGRCGLVTGVVEPARCGFASRDGHQVFFYEDPVRHDEHDLPVSGALIGDPFASGYTHDEAPWVGAYADFDAARAVVDRAADADDPLRIARAAGGKVGDLSTVPGLIATFASDPRALRDQTVRVRAVILDRRAWSSSDGHAGDSLRIADPAHRELMIGCAVDGAAAAPDGAEVTLEGRLADALGSTPWTRRTDGVPALEACRVR